MRYIRYSIDLLEPARLLMVELAHCNGWKPRTSMVRRGSTYKYNACRAPQTLSPVLSFIEYCGVPIQEQILNLMTDHSSTDGYFRILMFPIGWVSTRKVPRNKHCGLCLYSSDMRFSYLRRASARISDLHRRSLLLGERKFKHKPRLNMYFRNIRCM